MSDTLKIFAIVAMDEERAIGKDGAIPWRVPSDLKRFASLTKSHTVLMGRKTFDSLPPSYKPLPGRKNLVVSRSDHSYPGFEFWKDIESSLTFCRTEVKTLPSNILWIIGGSKIYEETKPYWDEVFLTKVPGAHAGDTFFPPFEDEFDLVESEAGEGCTFERYVRKERARN